MFSKSCRYAIRAILYIATYNKEDEKVSGKELAEKLDVPVYFLAKILQQLARNKVISSVKGPGGGFFLSQENRKQSLLEIIISIDGPGVFNECVLGLPSCSETKPCPLHVQAFTYREGLKYQLSHSTIQDQALRIQRKQIKI